MIVVLNVAYARFLPVALALVACLTLGTLNTYANRFGPPWQSRVSVDSTTLYTQPDRSSAGVGPLSRGQIVVVVGESTSGDGSAWTQTPDGWLPTDQIAEEWQPWIAEVTVPSVSIYARPSTKEPIRRTAKQGDLLRVTG